MIFLIFFWLGYGHFKKLYFALVPLWNNGRCKLKAQSDQANFLISLFFQSFWNPWLSTSESVLFNLCLLGYFCPQSLKLGKTQLSTSQGLFIDLILQSLPEPMTSSGHVSLGLLLSKVPFFSRNWFSTCKRLFTLAQNIFISPKVLVFPRFSGLFDTSCWPSLDLWFPFCTLLRCIM